MHTTGHFVPRSQVMRGGLVLGLLGLALLGACAQQPPHKTGSDVTVIVLPKPADGHVGAVMVRPLDGGKAVLLEKPYVEASLRDTKTGKSVV